MAPEKVVYVSCDPATLARDLAFLTANGFALDKWSTVDMFPHSMHVETVVKLSLKSDTPKVSITMEPEETHYSPEEKATYQKIKQYVKDKYGLNVHSQYIAQMKDKYGLSKQYTYDSTETKGRIPKCTPEKEEAILDAFKHFGMM